MTHSRLDHNQVVLAVAIYCSLGSNEDIPKVWRIQEISKGTGISWDTCRRSLELLKGLSIVDEVQGKSKYPNYFYIGRKNPTIEQVTQGKLEKITFKLKTKYGR
jgi:hypothetical protein